MEKKYRVLAINPGSTSTKVGVYEGYDMLYEGTVRHSQEELSKFEAIHDQKDMRMELVEELVEENGYKLSEMDAFVGRGGIVRPLKSGVYTINEKLMDVIGDTAIIEENGKLAIVEDYIDELKGMI